MRTLRWAAWVILAGAGLVSATLLLRPRIEGFAARTLARAVEERFLLPASVSEVEVDASGLAFVVRGLRVGSGGQPQVAADTIRVALHPWRSLQAGAIFTEVIIDGMKLNLRQGEEILRSRRGGGSLGLVGMVVARSFTARLTDAAGSRALEIVQGQASFEGRFQSVRIRLGKAWCQWQESAVPVSGKVLGRLRGTTLEIIGARATAPGLALRAAGGMDLRDGGLAIQATGRANAAQAEWLRGLVEHPFDDGGVTVQGTLSGSLAEPRFRGGTTVRNLRSGGQLLRFARLRIGASRRALSVGLAPLKISGGKLQAAARLTLAHPIRWRARAGWRGVGAGGAKGEGLEVVLAGRARSTGLMGAASGRLRGAVGLELCRKDRSRKLPLRVKAMQEDTNAWRVVLRSLGTENGWVSADLRVGKGNTLEGAVEVAVPDTSEFGSLLGLDLAGDARLEGRVKGSLSRPMVDATLTARKLRLGTVALREIGGSLEVSPEVVKTTGMRAMVGDGRVTLVGSISLAGASEGSLLALAEGLPVGQAVAFFSLWGGEGIGAAVAKGALWGRAEASGNWPAWHLSGQGEIRGAELWGQSVESLEVVFSGTRRNWEGAVRATGQGPLQIAASVRSQGENLSGEMTARGFRLDSIPALTRWVPSIAGELGVSGTVTGTMKAPVGRFSVEVASLELRGEEQGPGRLLAEVSRQGWSVSGALMGERIMVEASSAPGAARGWVKVRDVDLAALVSQQRAARVMARGEGYVAGKGWRVRELAGEIKLDELALTRELEVEMRVAGLRADLRGGYLTVARTDLESAGGRLSVAGGANLDTGEVVWDFSGSLDLALLEVLPGVVSSSGRMTLGVRGGRPTSGGWHAEGKVAVAGATLDLGLPVVISHLQGEAMLSDALVHVTSASARVGGGNLSVEGIVDLQGCPRLAWSAERVSPGIPPWLESRVSGRGAVSCPGDGGGVVISGEIEVLDALYERNLELADLISAPAPAPAVEEEGVGLDLHVVAQDGVYVDNNVANVELSADLRILGTLDHPAVLGKLETLAGELYLAGRTLSVSSAVVTFSDREKIDPHLDLFAETDVASADDEQHVWVQVTGTTKRNRVKFGADDPALSESDIVSLLALGGTPSNLSRSGAAIPVSRLFSLAPVGGSIEKEVVSALPVDRLEVVPSFSAATGTLEPRLTATKNLSAQLGAKMSTSLGSERSREFGLEYRITPELLLQGSWQSESRRRAGAFGGGLKFRHRFMDLPRLGGGR